MVVGAAAVLAAPLIASAPAKSDGAGAVAYPEFAPERTLPALAKSLRDTLLDPNSATNLVVCYPPVKVRMVGGRPARWTVMFALNSKNDLGGYTGLQEMAAVFYADKPVQSFSTGMPPSSRELATCTRIPDDELHQLMGVK